MALKPPPPPPPIATNAAKTGKDDERPKRPATPWIHFLADFRQQQKLESAGEAVKGAHVMKKASGVWKALSASDRQQWEAPYEVAKKEYELRKQEYAASSGSKAVSKPNGRRDPAKPKRPMTGFLRYLQEMRPKYTHLKMIDQTKELGPVWKTLSTAQKAPYENAYQEERKAYEKNMELYRNAGAAGGRDPAKPKKPITGFFRYWQEVRPKYVHLKVTEQSKEVGAAWKALSAEQKAPYEQAFQEEKRVYEKMMAEYKDSGKEEAWSQKNGPTTTTRKPKKAASKSSIAAM